VVSKEHSPLALVAILLISLGATHQEGLDQNGTKEKSIFVPGFRGQLSNCWITTVPLADACQSLKKNADPLLHLQLPRTALSAVVCPNDLESLHVVDCRMGTSCYRGPTTVQSKDKIWCQGRLSFTGLIG